MGTIVAGLEGVIAGESEICYIDGYAGVLSYRGYNIHTLADNATFEEVIYLLWNGTLPKADELKQLRAELSLYREVPKPVVELRHVSREFLPQTNWRRILQMRAPGLDDVPRLFRFCQQ